MNFLAIPVGVLLVTAGLIRLINRRQLNVGASWMLSVIAAVFVWGWSFFICRRLGESFPIGQTRRNIGIDFPLSFILDRVSWPFLMALASLLLATILSSSAFIRPDSSPRHWISCLLITAIGYVAVTADGVWHLVFCWTLFDIMDVVTRYLQDHSLDNTTRIVTAIRIIGTLLAAVSLVLPGERITLESRTTLLSASTGDKMLLFACVLRMGLIPLTQLYADSDEAHTGLYIMLRLVTILTVMPVICRLPLNVLSWGDMDGLLRSTACIAALIGSLGWILSPSGASGNTYAAMALCGLGIACVIRRQTDALIIWSTSVIWFCVPVTFYRIHSRTLSILPIISILCFSGLPYTPNAGGWIGLIAKTPDFMGIFLLLTTGILMGGGIRHMMTPGEKELTELEPWVRTSYPIGLACLFITQFAVSRLMGIAVSAGGRTVFAGIAFLTAILIAVFCRLLPRLNQNRDWLNWGTSAIDLFWRVSSYLLDLRWLLDILSFVGRILEKIVAFLSSVFNDRGGLVWEILLLVLMLVLAFSGDVL